MMRKAIFLSVVLTLAIALSAITVSACDSKVSLSTPTTSSITFSGDSTSLTMTIGPGPLTGMVSFGSGTASITLSGGPLAFTGGSGDFTSPGTLSMSVMPTGGSLFTGTLSNIALTSIPNTRMVILSGDLSGGDQVSLIIDGPSIGFLSKLMGSASGQFSAGEVLATVTPEPGTMLLFGSGLLLVAGVLRRKLIV